MPDYIKWVSIAVAFHPFMWGFSAIKDVRDKSFAFTVGPFTVGVNY